MRISRRTSGGRGEYEISGETVPEGLHAADLVGDRLIFDFGQGWIINTDTHLVSQGGKHRIRRLHSGQQYIQVQRQLAAALLMPHPVREDINLAAGLPILRANRYAIEQIELSSVDIQANTARLIVKDVELRNMSHHAEVLDFANRVAILRQTWTSAQQLPEPIRLLLNQHQQAVLAGGPIMSSVEAIVSSLQTQVTESAEDLGLLYRSADSDVLEDLQRVLTLAVEPPAQPTPIDQIDPEETQVRRRVKKEWKRWANSRGAASATFRQQVRAAYNSTCIVCGLHLPPTAVNALPGVDAAHILPWADFDLDVVSNGLCLCKLHHWAFDEGLIVIREDHGAYRVEIPADVSSAIGAENPNFSLAQLAQFTGPIPAERLPASPGLRPRPHYLQLLDEA